MSVVEVGQSFVNKDTGGFRQFQSVACLEYTLHEMTKLPNQKGGSREI